MKKILYFLGLNLAFFMQAQIPTCYYDGASGLTGYALKTKLSEIITNGHQDRGYSALMNAYKIGDLDKYYENDNTILDMYSENPNGPDPYNYVPGVKECGNYSVEGDCYNREHIFPQGFFNSSSPMRNDYLHIYPTDGKVNGLRNNYPFGTVGTLTGNTTTNPSKNGSKLGYSNFPGYSGIVFEPLDAFKGDIARSLLYFVTRYESRLQSFDYNDSNNPQDGSKGRSYDQWYINLLLKWHQDDPVSPREIARNNYAYTYQGNRNPYIDHPEYVTMIWTSTLATAETTALPSIKITTNPVKNGQLIVSGKDLNKISKAEIYSVSGQLVQSIERPFASSAQINLKNIKEGIYLLNLDGQTLKFVVE